MRPPCYYDQDFMALTRFHCKGNLILIGKRNRSRFIIKVPNHVTVCDEISKLVLHHTLIEVLRNQ